MTTTSRFRTVKAPRGRLVHFDYLNEGRADATARSTACGRKVPANWETTPVQPTAAVVLVTCPNCLAWARYHQVKKLAAAVEMPETRRIMFATDAANSAQRHTELVQLLAPVELPAFYGKPIDTPAGHRWAGDRRTETPPVHGPGQPEQFGRCADADTRDLLERGRRAIVRAEQLRRAAALRLLPPGGTLHA